MNRLPAAKRIIRQCLVILILTANIGCDQVSKHIVRQRMDYFEKIYLMDNHLAVTKVENTGAFLSLGNDMAPRLKMWLLTILPLVILFGAFIFVFIRKDLSLITLTGLCFFIGGGAGNIFDRLLFGSVTDFLHIDLGIFQTGVFNMADVSIMVGTGLLMWGTSGSNAESQSLREPTEK